MIVKLFLAGIVLAAGPIAMAGLPNQNSPFLCGESSREILREKTIELGNLNGLPVTLKVHVIKKLIGCAGAYGTASLKSALSIEISGKNPDQDMKSFLTNLIFYNNSQKPKYHALARVKLQLDSKMLLARPLFSVSYTNQFTPIKSSITKESDLFYLTAATDILERKKLFEFEAEITLDMNHIADYVESVLLEIEGLPATDIQLR